MTRQRGVVVREIDAILRQEELREKTVDLLGGQIRAKREAAGMSQAALAKRTGIKQSYLCRIERGRHRPGMMTLVRIAAGLRISLTELDAAFAERE